MFESSDDHGGHFIYALELPGSVPAGLEFCKRRDYYGSLYFLSRRWQLIDGEKLAIRLDDPSMAASYLTPQRIAALRSLVDIGTGLGKTWSIKKGRIGYASRAQAGTATLDAMADAADALAIA